MIQELLTYQEKDKELRKIELELVGSDERRKAVSAQKFIAEAVETINKMDNRATELCAQIKAVQDKQQALMEQQKEFSNALGNVTNMDEGEFILKKIDELLYRIKLLGDEIAKLLQESEEMSKSFEELKAKTQMAEKQYAEYAPKYQAIKNSRADEINAIKAELEKLAVPLDKGLLENYLAKRKTIKFPIVVEIAGDFCSGCNMEIPMGERAKIAAGEIVECEHCHRYMYKKK